MNTERAEAAHLLRDLGRDAKTIAANISELTEAEAAAFIKTGRLPGPRQKTLFGTANAVTGKSETRHGDKPSGPLSLFAKTAGGRQDQ